MVFIMDNLVLKSFRIDPELAAELKKVADRSDFYSQSDYVRSALRAWVALSNKYGAHYLLHFHPERGDVIDDVAFVFHRSHG